MRPSLLEQNEKKQQKQKEKTTWRGFSRAKRSFCFFGASEGRGGTGEGEGVDARPSGSKAAGNLGEFANRLCALLAVAHTRAFWCFIGHSRVREKNRPPPTDHRPPTTATATDNACIPNSNEPSYYFKNNNFVFRAFCLTVVLSFPRRDYQVHTANQVARRHVRSWLCDSCHNASAKVRTLAFFPD